MKSQIGQNMTTRPVRIGTHVSIREAQEVMQMWGMRHLPITNDNDQLIGLVSDRDISRAYASGLRGHEFVTDIMIEDPFCVESYTKVSEVAQIMADRKYGSAIVVDVQKRVLGIFTTTDALWLLAKLMKSPDENRFRLIQVGEYLEIPHQGN
ncbi:MAG: HPP family protein [Bdellovibrionales bacterium]